MKITKRQLRYLINESLNEEDDSDLGRRALSHVAAAGKALPPVAFAAALHDLAIYLTNPETDLEADVEEIWDKIDPRMQRHFQVVSRRRRSRVSCLYLKK